MRRPINPTTAEKPAPGRSAGFLIVSDQDFTSPLPGALRPFLPVDEAERAAKATALTRVSDKKKIGGIDPRGVEIGDLDGSLSKGQHGRLSVLRDVMSSKLSTPV